ncbi:MAG: glycosyltransferase family 4 protein [Nakamurella sp.]
MTSVAWCTPFSRPSAIGQFSAQVVAAMRDALGWDVDIFHPEGAGGRTVPDGGLPLGTDAEQVLGEYDHVVYNIGDNPANHAAQMRLLRTVPGLVLLHDVSLIHLLLPDLVHGPEDAARAEFVRWYGPEAAVASAALRSDELKFVQDPENIRRYPMIEPVLEHAPAVVTHSQWAAGRVRDAYAGDVWVLPLPREPLQNPQPSDLPGIDDRLIILQAGVPNRNKHIDKIIEAFDDADIADRAQLVICGYGTDEAFEALRELVAERSLQDSVHLLGRVEDDVMDELRRRALVSTVLRFPFGEAASAALLDAMSYGHAVLTVDGGHYAEVPDETVRRISVPPIAADIAPVLRRWIDDPDSARELGSRAAHFVATEHTAEIYGRGIAEILQQSGSFFRRRDLVDMLSRTLHSLGFGPQDPITSSVAGDAAELFSGEPVVAAEIYPPGSTVSTEPRAEAAPRST